MSVQVLRGKKVSVHGDGEIFVDGKKTNLKQWKSSPTRYSNLSGQEKLMLVVKIWLMLCILRDFYQGDHY